MCKFKRSPLCRKFRPLVGKGPVNLDEVLVNVTFGNGREHNLVDVASKTRTASIHKWKNLQQPPMTSAGKVSDSSVQTKDSIPFGRFCGPLESLRANHHWQK